MFTSKWRGRAAASQSAAKAATDSRLLTSHTCQAPEQHGPGGVAWINHYCTRRSLQLATLKVARTYCQVDVAVAAGLLDLVSCLLTPLLVAAEQVERGATRSYGLRAAAGPHQHLGCYKVVQTPAVVSSPLRLRSPAQNLPRSLSRRVQRGSFACSCGHGKGVCGREGGTGAAAATQIHTCCQTWLLPSHTRPL